MKMPLLLPAVLLVAACGPTASYREILTRSKAELSQREDWAELALIRIQDQPGYGHPTWRVSAGAMDFSDYPDYRGLRLVPGTERVLHFTRDGCLLRYADDSDPCGPRPAAPPNTGTAK